MSGLDEALRDLAIANRILAREDVVDGFGHVSIRHPEEPHRFILSRSRAPGLVTVDDLMVYEIDGSPVDAQGRAMYAERFIHSGLYESRPDVTAVIHNHSLAVIPFAVTGAPIRPPFHMAAVIGEHVPVWDISHRFGDTNLLVTTLAQGRDLARAVGGGAVALMRGHGCVVAASSLHKAVMCAIYLQVNAALQMDALRLGQPSFLSPGEIARAGQPTPLSLERAWEYWCRRADLSGL